jgi:hypothetical protein
MDGGVHFSGKPKRSWLLTLAVAQERFVVLSRGIEFLPLKNDER